MSNERIYRSGYAHLLSGDETNRVWKYRDEEITLPAGAVAEIEHRGLKMKLAHIEGVRTAQEATSGRA
jgi:hypothetical protein